MFLGSQSSVVANCFMSAKFYEGLYLSLNEILFGHSLGVNTSMYYNLYI